MLFIYQMILYKLPTFYSLIKSIIVRKMLIKIDMSHYIFSLNPPMPFHISFTCLRRIFIRQASISIYSFIRS